MNRRDLTLAILAAARGLSYTPVQLQKATFLVTRNVAGIVDDGPTFNFTPYDYGPFDAAVYDEALELQRASHAVVAPSPFGRWNVYSASEAGVQRGGEILLAQSEAVRLYINEVSAWVRSQGFGSLVRSIYNAYPEMRENSIFRG